MTDPWAQDPVLRRKEALLHDIQTTAILVCVYKPQRSRQRQVALQRLHNLVFTEHRHFKHPLCLLNKAQTRHTRAGVSNCHEEAEPLQASEHLCSCMQGRPDLDTSFLFRSHMSHDASVQKLQRHLQIILAMHVPNHTRTCPKSRTQCQVG